MQKKEAFIQIEEVGTYDLDRKKYQKNDLDIKSYSHR